MMESNEDNPDDFVYSSEPAILPTRAKDMFGLTGEIIQGYAENGMHDELVYSYGINEDEAWLSLHCADLASLPAWDAEALLEAATVYFSHNLRMAARYDYAVGNDELDFRERTKRRIQLALLAEKAPDVMSPADGIRLLGRAGIRVFYELLEAVAVLALDGNDPERTYRELMGIPHTDTKPQAVTVEPAPVVQTPIKHGPGWTLKPSLERSPGYRWPLYQILKAAHIKGQPCPKPREVLEIWKLDPPPDIQVMPDGVKYNDGLGNPREANLSAIGKAIKYLLHS